MTSMMMMTMMVIVIAGYCVVLFTCSGFVVTVQCFCFAFKLVVLFYYCYSFLLLQTLCFFIAILTAITRKFRTFIIIAAVIRISISMSIGIGQSFSIRVNWFSNGISANYSHHNYYQYGCDCHRRSGDGRRLARSVVATTGIVAIVSNRKTLGIAARRMSAISKVVQVLYPALGHFSFRHLGVLLI